MSRLGFTSLPPVRRPPTVTVLDAQVTQQSSTQILPTLWNPNDLSSIPGFGLAITGSVIFLVSPY